MKILHFIQSLDARTGGPARAAIDLCSALALAGNDVRIVTSESSPEIDTWSDSGSNPKVVLIRKTMLSGQLLRRADVTQIKNHIRWASVVHTHGVWELANVEVCRLAARLHRPYVVTPHGLLDDWPMCQSRLKKRIFYALVGKQALSAASSVHLATRAEFEQSKKWFPPERGVVIPNVLDLTPFRSLPSPSEIQDRLCTLPKSAFKVLFLSRLHPIKGLEVVLRAANILKHRGREVALVVAGDGDPGYFQSVRALATELNLGSHEILFLGSVTGRLKLALFQSCNVFALPTQHENFGYVLVEALACGLPVITTKASGLSVEIASSGVGQVADATPEGFADAIEVMLDNRATLELVGKTARPWAFDYLDSRQVIARYVQMYSDSVT